MNPDTTHVVNREAGKPDEYLRRNLFIAKACGAKAEIKLVTDRLLKTKRVPKWLLVSLDAMRVRVEELPQELAKWRDASPDNPHSPERLRADAERHVAKLRTL